MTAAAPTPDEIGVLLGETQSLDEPAKDPYADENSAFMAAARQAVGTEKNAMALKDAMEACLREHGLIGGSTDEESNPDEAEPDADTDDVGKGFDDY